MKKITALMALVLLTVMSNLVVAQSDTQPPKKDAAANTLATRAEVEAAWQRTFGYDSAASWKILNVGPSSVPGMTKVVAISGNQLPVTAYILPDKKNAIVGELIPFGADPFATTREKLAAADGPARGPASPAIVIVEFVDLECQYCKATQPIVKKLIADFPQVRFVIQQMPLAASVHPWAMKAAEYADCASNMNKEAFWTYVDSIYENQGGIALATADDKLKELATAAGLDAQKVAACAATPQTEARVKKSFEFGRSAGVDALPSIFINGRKVTTAAYMPYEKLKEMVQFEIDHAGK